MFITVIIQGAFRSLFLNSRGLLLKKYWFFGVSSFYETKKHKKDTLEECFKLLLKRLCLFMLE